MSVCTGPSARSLGCTAVEAAFLWVVWGHTVVGSSDLLVARLDVDGWVGAVTCATEEEPAVRDTLGWVVQSTAGTHGVRMVYLAGGNGAEGWG